MTQRSVSSKWEFIEDALAARKRENRFRTLHPLKTESGAATVQRDGKTLVNFCSNDYLGLSGHPKLIERAAAYAETYGAGSTASRLISGTYAIHEELERKLARTFGSEAALIFNSGFQANSTIPGTITDRNSLILADRLSHNSLLQGSLLSRATFRRFGHNDLDHLEALLQRAEGKSYNRILIVTETVFSMDGDRSDPAAIAELADRYNAMLFVDDAHAVGVWGPNGLGLSFGVEGVDMTLGTFGKAFGVFGAFVTCPQQMRDYLINFCPGFIYTTALPPPVIGALDAALELIPEMEEERERYHQKIKKVKRELVELGYDTGASTSQIIPVIVGEDQKTLKLSEYLRERHGILATAIRPPTVSEQSSRIRLTVTSIHTDEQIKHLIDALGRWNGR